MEGLLRQDIDPVTGVRMVTSTTMGWLMRPLQLWFDPVFTGWEHLDPARPCLLVMNHTIYGGLDLPLIFAGVYQEKGVMVRGLADKAQFALPGLRDLELRIGAVEGTPENCANLMKHGEFVLVCPGGGREVCKRKGEAYKLTWKQRVGFVRMAIQHGYPMVPLASVGADEAFTILVDAEDILRSPAGKLLELTGLKKGVLRNGDIIPPFALGLGPTLIPRPVRQYFAFGKPIETQPFQGREDDKELLWELRRQVEDSLNAQIKDLLLSREHDRVGPLRRMLTHL